MYDYAFCQPGEVQAPGGPQPAGLGLALGAGPAEARLCEFGGATAWEAAHGGARAAAWTPGSDDPTGDTLQDLADLISANSSAAHSVDGPSFEAATPDPPSPSGGSSSSPEPASDDVEAPKPPGPDRVPKVFRRGPPGLLRQALRAAERDALARKAAEAADMGASAERRMKAVMQAAGVVPPSLSCAWRGLTVAAAVAVAPGGAGVPTVGSTAAGLARRRRPRKRVELLAGVSGVLEPATSTVLLGPPGSGKSVLLKALAGLAGAEPHVTVAGDVFFCGQRADALHLSRAMAYVPQEDCHIPNLTVRETLLFAALCQVRTRGDIDREVDVFRKLRELDLDHPPEGPAEAGGQVTDSVRAFHGAVKTAMGEGAKVEIQMELFGLTTCADTVVGDGLLRGISGGQRKRVSMAEKMVGRPGGRILLADEISTGLDSATTYSICSWSTGSMRVWNNSMLMALLQVEPKTLFLFDKAIVLSEGRVAYSGPVEAMQRYVEGIVGCKALKSMDLVEWVLNAVDRDLQADLVEEYLISAEMEEESGYFDGSARREDLRLPDPEKIAAAYLESDHAAEEGRAVAKFTEETEEGEEVVSALALDRQRHALTFWQMFRAVMQRERLLQQRDKALLRSRVIRTLVMAVIVGTVFLQIPADRGSGIQTLAAIYFAVNFLSFGAMPQMAQVLGQKPILIKQRNDGWYSGLAYGLVHAIYAIPMGLLDALLFTPIFYFTVGFNTAADSFFVFLLIVLLVNMSMGGFFRFLGAAAPNLVIASALGGITLLFLLLTSGFTLPPANIPPWIIWIYWISPFAYGFRGLAINEFLSAKWAVPVGGGGGTLGVAMLEQVGLETEYYWVWVTVAYLAGFWLVMVALTCYFFERTTGQTKRHVFFEAAPAEKGAEEGSFGSPLKHFHENDNTITKLSSQENLQKLVSEPDAGTRSLVFESVVYSVPVVDKESKKKRALTLLHGISGYAKGKEITALMGPSGAGKTTLLDVIAFRKTYGSLEGQIFVDGHEVRSAEEMNRTCAYVEQFDSISPLATAKEAVFLSAVLRLPYKGTNRLYSRRHFSNARIAARRALESLELREAEQRALVGLPGAGMSLEQRKRLSIAMELVVSPKVLFLDEPTSGLDAHAASVVVDCIVLIAQDNTAIVCTIHQPSAHVFMAFHQLLLLQKGGRTAYFGPVREMELYFAKGYGAPGCPVQANPAAWVLDVIGAAPAAGEGHAAGSWEDAYAMSELREVNASEAERLLNAGTGAAAAGPAETLGVVPQFYVLVQRQWRAYWRNVSYNFTRLASTVAVSLVLGIVYFGEGDLGAATGVASLQSALGFLYIGPFFLGLNNANMVQPVLISEREVFYRERASGMYRIFPYFLAVYIVEVPYLLLQTVIYTTITYWMVGFQLDAKKYVFYALVTYSMFGIFTKFGMCLSVLAPTRAVAQVLSSFIVIFWNMFCGFGVTQNEMPVFWVWVYYLCPTSWSLYALGASQFGDSEASMKVLGMPTNGTAAEYIERRWGYQYDFRWKAFGILYGFHFALLLVLFVAIRYVNWQAK